MENSNQPHPHPAQVSSQRYNHQMPPTMWNNKVCQSTSGQNTSLHPYSQQMNQYYQAQYPSQANDMNRYASPVPKDQNSNPTYAQYPMSRQGSYPGTIPGQNYQMSMKTNCNNMYYANATKNYPPNNAIHTSKKYVNSGLGLPHAHPSAPQSSQMQRNTGTPMPQMPQYRDPNNYSMQNTYVSNYNVHTNTENDQSYMLQQAMSSPTTALSSQESLIHSVPMVSSSQVSQMSSIPTPPETSSLPGDGLSADNTSTDNIKMGVSNAPFALPGSVIGHMPSPASSVTNVAGISNRNPGIPLQPPANLDEGSQASSASASSSIPDEQNSVKANSKPNFSYPPTPNTLSSPGAASMSSFHDDLECISSPGWPKTPASPVANGNYEFANIKRPENLLKLYTLSDEPDRRYFLDKLIVFSEDRGNPLSQCPTISKQPLDVYRVYITVKERGGFVEVTNAKRWKDIAGAIGVGASSSAAYTLRKQYMKILLPFECKFDRGGIDPQPIINMVEASSRKKGKNVPAGSYGNPSHYSHGYPQPMERYPSYPGAYQSSRYNNTMDYQCTSNTMNYPQSTSNVPHNSTTGHNQYGSQYPHGPSSNYRYYQGSNSTTNASYNSNIQNTNDNLCRFGRSATSTPVPQEQAYYSQQFPAPQTDQNIQDIFGSNRGCSTQENLTLPAANQINDIDQLASFAPVNNSVDMSPLKPDNVVLTKPNTDNFGTINMEVSLTDSTTEPSQDNKICFNSSYSAPSKNVGEQSSVSKSFIGPSAPQTYQQSMTESSLNKTPEANYYSETSSQYTNRNQTYINQGQTYPNQKMPYQADYQSKEQVQPDQYTPYAESQNESYCGSEGPPRLQMDRIRNIPASDSVATKPYPYNSNISSKANSYAYVPQQGQNKETLSHSVYSNQFSNRPQRAWHSEQNHHPYQRPQLKNQLNPHEGKQHLEHSRPRRSWLPFQNSASPQNKSQTVSGSNSMSQSFLQIKSQPLSNSATQLQSIVKKPYEFPPNTIEAIRPVAVKRRRCPAKRLGSIDPWRLMLALKSGLLAECTWALDSLSILLADNSTVIYFNLEHLPGLLNVLVDHYRCYLNKIFNLAKDMEIEKNKKHDTDSSSDRNADLSDVFNLEEKDNVLDTSNYTFKTRCNKKVEIQYDEALFLIDPQNTWDTYEDFNVSAEHWQKGGGDITSHIETCFAEDTKKVKFARELEDVKRKTLDIKNLSKNKPNFFKSSLLCKGEPVVVLKKCKLSDDKIDNILNLESEMDTEDSCSIIFSTLDKDVDKSDKPVIPEKDGESSDLKNEYDNNVSLKLAENSEKNNSTVMNSVDLTKMSSEKPKGHDEDVAKNIMDFTEDCSQTNSEEQKSDSSIDLLDSHSENDNFSNKSITNTISEKVVYDEDLAKNKNPEDTNKDLSQAEFKTDSFNNSNQDPIIATAETDKLDISNKDPIIATAETDKLDISNKDPTKTSSENANFSTLNKEDSSKKESLISCDKVLTKDSSEKKIDINKNIAEVTYDSEKSVTCNEDKENSEKDNNVDSSKNPSTNSENDNSSDDFKSTSENCVEFIDLTKPCSEEKNCVDFTSNDDLKASSEQENCIDLTSNDGSKASFEEENCVDLNSIDLQASSEEKNCIDTSSNKDLKATLEDEDSVNFIDLTKLSSEDENCVDLNSTEDLKAGSENKTDVDFIDITKNSSDKDTFVISDDLKHSPKNDNDVDTNNLKSSSGGDNIVVHTQASFKTDTPVDSSDNLSTDSIKNNKLVDSKDTTVHSNEGLAKTYLQNEKPVDSDDITKTLYESDSKLPSATTGNQLNIKCDIDEPSIKSDVCDEIKESSKSNEVTDSVPRLRGSLSSRKRFLCADLEDEAFSFDEPALCVTSDSQEMLSRRCVCVSTIIRNLSFVPNNDLIMSKNPGVLILLGRLLLLHHEHRPAKNAYQKYEKEAYGESSWEESCTSLKDEPEWWLSTLKVLRDNTLVILSNISGHLDLSPFPEEVSLPILDGLLHWIVCPSSYAQDPLPSRSPSSVLSPQRLCLETLCKLSVLSNNVDLIIATPPWSRIETLFTFLTKSLSSEQDQIMREFALILLSNISQADSTAARTIADQNSCISYLISFMEEAESKSFHIASSQGTKKLRDKPELMGTTPGMVQRAANVLKHLALVPENRGLFMKYQPRLLSLVMSQIMDQELAVIVADILFFCSNNMMAEYLLHLPMS